MVEATPGRACGRLPERGISEALCDVTDGLIWSVVVMNQRHWSKCAKPSRYSDICEVLTAMMSCLFCFCFFQFLKFFIF